MSQSSRPRVVLCGLGAISPLGLTAPEFWEGLTAGRSGIGRITQFDASALPCQIAGEVRGFEPKRYMDFKEARRMSRSSQMAVATAREAMCDAGFADATGGFLPLVCTLNATKVTDAIARLLGVGHDEFDRLALAAPAGAAGVTVLPYFDGERTPNLPKSSGLLAGIRSDVTREQLARAAVEGVVCGLLDALDALRNEAPVNAVRLVGGGARSAAYRQVVAELCDLPAMLADAGEAVATGACVQAAAVALGITHAEVTERWGLGVGTPLPMATGDPAGVRARYAELRSSTHPATA